MFNAVPASRRYPCVLIVFWRLATKICPLRASLARLFAFCVTGPSWPPLAVFLADSGAKRDRAVQERGRRHVLCVRARQMHQRARSGASHGCKWDQHGIFNRFYVNRSARGVPSARCAVFCGVLRCFVFVSLAFFTKQHKTDQKIYKTHKTNKIRFVQYSAIRCCASFSHSENDTKTFAKHVQNIAKHPQNTAKHRKTLFFKKHSQNTTKHLQNTRKTPQNTAKHHKTDLLTKQTKLANKPLRSQETRQTRHTYKNRPPRQHNHNGLTLNPMEDYDYDYARRIFISRHACDAREELLQAWEDSYKTE